MSDEKIMRARIERFSLWLGKQPASVARAREFLRFMQIDMSPDELVRALQLKRDPKMNAHKQFEMF